MNFFGQLLQLIQDIRSRENESQFRGTPYVPVYVMLAVSGCYFVY